MTLIEFFTARLDEREAIALAVDPEGWHEATKDGLRWNEYEQTELDHIRANGPAYVLADVDAKRRIVEVHAVGPHPCKWGPGSLLTNEAECKTLRLLALPYAGHPDYDQNWRPA